MKCFIVVLLALAVAAAKPNPSENAKLNKAPIIGVVVKEVFSDLDKVDPGKYKSYIPAPIVKFVEGGGARVVPVWLGQDQKYYENVVKNTNGLVFMPGRTGFSKKCGSAAASTILYNLAVEENKKGNHYPIFAISQGMSGLLYAATNNPKITVDCEANKTTYTLDFKPDFEASKMYKPMPDTLIAAHKKEKISSSFQGLCLTEQKLKEEGIEDEWHVLATNKDKTGTEFISAIEHQTYPFYGVQFRPELNLYVWDSKSVDHSLNAILSSQYFAAFFVNEASKNSHKYASPEDEQKDLIYNYAPKYINPESKHFKQTYLFGADKGTTC